VLFHVDAAQSAGKIPVDVRAMAVDLLSLSAHKLYGPKGVGALYVGRRPRVELEAQIHGGGHERGMRSGTLATHQAVGMGAACALAAAEMATESARILQLRERFRHGISSLPDVFLNGAAERRLPGNLNLSFGGVDGEALLLALKDLALSTGSACTSASLDPSYVLRALGVSNALALSALRFSFGRFTSEQDVDTAVELLLKIVPALRAAG
jgi:cysteine desulfurase